MQRNDFASISVALPRPVESRNATPHKIAETRSLRRVEGALRRAPSRATGMRSQPRFARRSAWTAPMPAAAAVMRAVPFEGELLMFFSLSASARNSLGGGPVCGPVSVAENLFTRMRCELDHDRPARHAEQLDADVDDCST